jgi:hypothetical protein
MHKLKHKLRFCLANRLIVAHIFPKLIEPNALGFKLWLKF